jgi:hypothetical protein
MALLAIVFLASDLHGFNCCEQLMGVHAAALLMAHNPLVGWIVVVASFPQIIRWRSYIRQKRSGVFLLLVQRRLPYALKDRTFESLTRDLARLAQLVAGQQLRTSIEVEASWHEIGEVAQRLVQRQFTGKAVLHLA